jgi:hypothetical protein
MKLQKLCILKPRYRPKYYWTKIKAKQKTIFVPDAPMYTKHSNLGNIFSEPHHCVWFNFIFWVILKEGGGGREEVSHTAKYTSIVNTTEAHSLFLKVPPFETEFL